MASLSALVEGSAGLRSLGTDRPVAKDTLTYEDLLRIVELVKSSPQFSEFRLKVGEIELHLKRKREPGAARSADPSSARSPEETTGSRAADECEARNEQAWPDHWVIVRSPMVGTFYRAPVPGAPPFVEVGQAVAPDATVCIIEVMKLMNSIAAGARGVIRGILVDDAKAVEYGQPLVVLEPQ
jgi:acetyl-CoA carboxylase biotin carboxyl carrier protein